MKPLRPTTGISTDELATLQLLARGWRLDGSVCPALARLQAMGLAVFKGRIGRFKVSKAGRRLAAQLKD